MKKSILIFSFILIVSSVFSQFSFGPKIGYNSAKLSLDRSDINSELKNNFQFGVFVRIGTKIYLQTEVNWVSQGSIFKTPEASIFDAFEQEVKLSTIQVPLMLGAKVIDLKLFNLRVFGGPTASFISKVKIDNKLATGIEPISEADIEDIIWSFQVGAGFDVVKLTLDIRYNFGINNVMKTVQIDGGPVEFSSKTNGFNVTVGWKMF